MLRMRTASLCGAMLIFAGVAAAQAPAASDSAPPVSPFTRYGADFSFVFDGYAIKNFNNPPSGFNQLRNFDMRANTAAFNMGMMSIDRKPSPVGFHVDVGFGRVFDAVGAADEAPEELKYIKQAFVSLKPKALGGLQIDAGKFVTSAGAEVIESYQNWNYSRSILFAWAIPYYHFGVRTSFPVGARFTGGVQVVQGWNNVEDNNSGKTIGLTGSYAWDKVTWSNVYYVGPEKKDTNTGFRQVYDTTVLVVPSERLSYYINFDYGREKNIGSGAAQWAGIAGAARYSFNRQYAVASRLEYFKDVDGFSTGVSQALKEVTVTGEYKPADWLISRLEFRHDWSNQPFFDKASGGSNRQSTVLVGLVAVFGPKR